MKNKGVEIWIKLMDISAKYWGCHQMPQRSFFLGDWQFPICARCTGVLVGYIMAMFCRSLLRHRLSLSDYMMLMLPMAVDGGIQYISRYESTNLRRFFTGLLAGIGLMSIVLNLVACILSALHKLLEFEPL